MQFLMLQAIEGGASLTEATDEALAWGTRHPETDLFEQRPYAQWQPIPDDQDDQDDQDDPHRPDDQDAATGAGPPRPHTPPEASPHSRPEAWNYRAVNEISSRSALPGVLAGWLRERPAPDQASPRSTHRQKGLLRLIRSGADPGARPALPASDVIISASLNYLGTRAPVPLGKGDGR